MTSNSFSEIYVGDRFVDPDGRIYICKSAYVSVNIPKSPWRLRVMKKKLPRSSYIIRRVSLISGRRPIDVVHKDPGPKKNRREWIIKHGLKIIDKNGYIRGGQEVKLKKI